MEITAPMELIIEGRREVLSLPETYARLMRYHQEWQEMIRPLEAVPRRLPADIGPAEICDLVAHGASWNALEAATGERVQTLQRRLSNWFWHRRDLVVRDAVGCFFFNSAAVNAAIFHDNAIERMRANLWPTLPLSALTIHPYLDSAVVEMLRAAGIASFSDLMTIDPETLRKVPRLGPKRLAQVEALITRAKDGGLENDARALVNTVGTGR